MIGAMTVSSPHFYISLHVDLFSIIALILLSDIPIECDN